MTDSRAAVGGGVWAAMRRPLKWSLLFGPLPAALVLICFSLREHRWWRRVLPMALAGSLIGAVAGNWVIDGWWRPFPDPLSSEVLTWVWLALTGATLAGRSLHPRSTVGQGG